jgi:uncharacterized membrane protein YgcG
MDIDYKLSNTDKKVIKLYLRRKYVKRIMSNNALKNSYSYNYKKKSFSHQIYVLIACVLFVFSVVYFSLNDPSSQNIIIIYLMSTFLVIALLKLLKPFLMNKMYEIYKSRIKKLQKSLRWCLVSIDVDNYIRKSIISLSRISIIQLNFIENMGVLISKSGQKQRFSCKSLKVEGRLDDVIFYIFTDELEDREYLLPIPVSYTSAFNSSGEHLQLSAKENVAINASGDISAGAMGSMHYFSQSCRSSSMDSPSQRSGSSSSDSSGSGSSGGGLSGGGSGGGGW